MTTKDDKQADQAAVNRISDQAAVERVREMISDYRTILEGITLLKEDATPDPVLIEGETRKGYYCQLMVDPREIAQILLNYNYPVCRILDDEAPEAMWRDLGEKFGLDSVTSFDL